MDLANKMGYTALHYSALYGQTRMAKFLLRLGANKLYKDTEGMLAAELAIAK
jgi:ankyrin repeat protein